MSEYTEFDGKLDDVCSCVT